MNIIADPSRSAKPARRPFAEGLVEPARPPLGTPLPPPPIPPHLAARPPYGTPLPGPVRPADVEHLTLAAAALGFTTEATADGLRFRRPGVCVVAPNAAEASRVLSRFEPAGSVPPVSGAVGSPDAGESLPADAPAVDWPSWTDDDRWTLTPAELAGLDRRARFFEPSDDDERWLGTLPPSERRVRGFRFADVEPAARVDRWASRMTDEDVARVGAVG